MQTSVAMRCSSAPSFPGSPPNGADQISARMPACTWGELHYSFTRFCTHYRPVHLIPDVEKHHEQWCPPKSPSTPIWKASASWGNSQWLALSRILTSNFMSCPAEYRRQLGQALTLLRRRMASPPQTSDKKRIVHPTDTEIPMEYIISRGSSLDKTLQLRHSSHANRECGVYAIRSHNRKSRNSKVTYACSIPWPRTLPSRCGCRNSQRC